MPMIKQNDPDWKYAIIKIYTSGQISLSHRKTEKISLHDWQTSLGGGFIEIVGGRILQTVGDKHDIKMIVDEDGLNKQLKVNPIASSLYDGGAIVGDVLIGVQKMIGGEPDIAAMPIDVAKDIIYRIEAWALINHIF